MGRGEPSQMGVFWSRLNPGGHVELERRGPMHKIFGRQNTHDLADGPEWGEGSLQAHLQNLQGQVLAETTGPF